MKRSRGVPLTVSCLVALAWLGTGPAGWARTGLSGPKKGFARVPAAFRNVKQKIKLGVRRHLPKRMQLRKNALDGVMGLMDQHRDLMRSNSTSLMNIGLGKYGKWVGAGFFAKGALYSTNPYTLAGLAVVSGALYVAQKKHENLLMRNVVFEAKRKGYAVPGASMEWYQQAKRK